MKYILKVTFQTLALNKLKYKLKKQMKIQRETQADNISRQKDLIAMNSFTEWNWELVKGGSRVD